MEEPILKSDQIRHAHLASRQGDLPIGRNENQSDACEIHEALCTVILRVGMSEVDNPTVRVK